MGKAKPAAVIETLADLTPDPRNARRHNPRNVGMLEKALGEVGAARSIVIDERGVVLAGNATIEAAARAGIEKVQVVDADGETIIAVRRTGLTAKQKTRLALYDNRTAELADWDADVIADLLATEREVLDGLFADDELAELIDDLGEPEMADAEPQIDRAAELNKKWKVQAGDLWRVGEHRLLCGDSTKREDVARVMGGEKAVLMTTDPPYGVDYGELVRSRKNQKAGGWTDIRGDALSDDEMRSMLTCSLDGAGALVAFVWHPPGARRFLFWEALEANGWRVAQEIVWVKNALVFGRADYQWRHEPCLYAKRDGAPSQSDRTQTTVWECNKPTDSQHPTQKPVELFTRPIKNHTTSGAIVYDPFLGSGTTMVACENLHRKCRGIEISPDYCAVILERMATAFPALAIERA